MIILAVCAVTLALFLIYAIQHFYQGSKNPLAVPGLERASKEHGNLADIGAAGSLHEFLIDLHKRFGSIASFWMGPEQVVSIASPELFKEHQNVFDRPVSLFKLFEPLITPHNIQYANGSEGRTRRQHYDKVFTFDAMEGYYPKFHKVTDEMIRKLNSFGKDEHIPLNEVVFEAAIKAALWVLVGRKFTDSKVVLEFKKNYDIVWSDMEARVSGDIPVPGSEREKNFNEAAEKVHAVIKDCLDDAKRNPTQDLVLLDVLVSHFDDKIISCDVLAYIIGGFHTTGNHLAWCFYFLATHKDVQDKLYKEIKSVVGDDEYVTSRSIKDLQYLRQVIDETFRCAVVAPWAARYKDCDSQLGGYDIPKNTPVIHALGVCLQNEKYWPQPKRFDPERFSKENIKPVPTLAFSPFGFAGKRMCPAYRFSYAELSVVIAGVINKFEVDIVGGQNVKRVYGLVTHTAEEVWVTVKKRNS